MRLKKFSTLAGLVALSSYAAPAMAGGVGLLGTGGLHQENVYFYDQSENQYLQIQYRQSVGTGLYVMLGDRDDRVQGIMKLFWLADAPPDGDVGTLPDGFDGDPQVPVRTDVRNVGVAMTGIQWSLLGDPSAASFNLISNIGAGAMTSDFSEFAYAELGPGGHITFGGNVQVFGEVVYQARWRKGLSHGGGGTVGVRYLFD
jgi:hypothetical protein